MAANDTKTKADEEEYGDHAEVQKPEARGDCEAHLRDPLAAVAYRVLCSVLCCLWKTHPPMIDSRAFAWSWT